MDLNGEYVETWNSYTNYLQKCSVFINDEEDAILCSIKPYGGYKPRLKYETMALEGNKHPFLWWWKTLWKYKCPKK